MVYYQYLLRSGNTTLTCWLGWKTRLKLGSIITLKKVPDMKWTVRNVFGPELDQPPDTDWHVGGLE